MFKLLARVARRHRRRSARANSHVRFDCCASCRAPCSG